MPFEDTCEDCAVLGAELCGRCSLRLLDWLDGDPAAATVYLGAA